jgi:hypothetical protein
MLQQATLQQPGIGVQFWRLTKPRVVSLIVFTAVIGMLLAAPTLPPAGLLAAATAGIALVAGAAAAFNCLVEQRIDAAMARTRGRPTIIGTITDAQILLFSGVVGGLGPRHPVARGEPAHDVAHARDIRGLRDRVHRDPQAAHAAEHRDRRRLGRDAAAARLGCRHR